MSAVKTWIKNIEEDYFMKPTEVGAIDYKYNEGNLLDEIQSYIDATYNQHYSRNKFQALCNSTYTTLKIRIKYGY